MANWFQNVGHHPNSSLESWDAWPSPEVPECEVVGTITQELFDDLSAKFEISYDMFMSKVNEFLSDIASVHEWDENEDCYDPRSTAAWEAAWWLALKHYYQEYNVVELPEIIERMIEILESGNWPYALNQQGEILVF